MPEVSLTFHRVSSAIQYLVNNGDVSAKLMYRIQPRKRSYLAA